MLFASYWTVHVTSARPLWTRILWFLFSVYRHHRPSHPGPRLWLTTSSWQLCEVHLSCNDLCACSSILFPWSRQVSVVCAKFAGFFSLVGIFNSVDRCSDCLFLLTSALAAVSNLHIFDDHHHFIMHSSCHHSLLTHFLIRSHTYAWRVWYGGVGGWVGGDNDVRYN